MHEYIDYTLHSAHLALRAVRSGEDKIPVGDDICDSDDNAYSWTPRRDLAVPNAHIAMVHAVEWCSHVCWLGR